MVQSKESRRSENGRGIPELAKTQESSLTTPVVDLEGLVATFPGQCRSMGESRSTSASGDLTSFSLLPCPLCFKGFICLFCSPATSYGYVGAGLYRRKSDSVRYLTYLDTIVTTVFRRKAWICPSLRNGHVGRRKKMKFANCFYFHPHHFPHLKCLSLSRN